MKKTTDVYLENILPESPAWSVAIEKEAIKQNIPIMDRVSMQFVCQMIRLRQPKQILEIGTAIGYSALRMLEAVPSSTIVTIERDENRYNRAKELIEENNQTEKIHLIHGDAADILTSLQTTGHDFDVAFIDAAKGQYQTFFECTDPMIRDGGMIISDNVLFRGLVASEEKDTKYQTLVKKLTAYNEWIMNHPSYHTSIVPIGDGVGLSIKDKQ